VKKRGIKGGGKLLMEGKWGEEKDLIIIAGYGTTRLVIPLCVGPSFSSQVKGYKKAQSRLKRTNTITR